MPFANDTNLGRVAKMVQTLELMEVSGKSNNAKGEDYAAILQPVFDKIGDLLGASVTVTIDTDPTPPADAPMTPPVANEAGNLEHLTTTQLVDRMIACGAILASRRQ